MTLRPTTARPVGFRNCPRHRRRRPGHQLRAELKAESRAVDALLRENRELQARALCWFANALALAEDVERLAACVAASPAVLPEEDDVPPEYRVPSGRRPVHLLAAE